MNVKYRLTIIEETSPPEGMDDGDWYRYVVEDGKSAINCIREGSLKDVTEHAEAFVENLNSRTKQGFSGYAHRKQAK
ncbi:MAG: hypothetical protein OEZ38_06955 [Gammaproteobacteria bacterium]|nr:hypothetical protein [Gammaproteobacteria bacterium]